MNPPRDRIHDPGCAHRRRRDIRHLAYMRSGYPRRPRYAADAIRSWHNWQQKRCRPALVRSTYPHPAQVDRHRSPAAPVRRPPQRAPARRRRAPPGRVPDRRPAPWPLTDPVPPSAPARPRAPARRSALPPSPRRSPPRTPGTGRRGRFAAPPTRRRAGPTPVPDARAARRCVRRSRARDSPARWAYGTLLAQPGVDPRRTAVVGHD
jgi:hypothetical protein